MLATHSSEVAGNNTPYEVTLKRMNSNGESKETALESLRQVISNDHNNNIRVTLPISVGQTYHLNGRFKSQLMFLRDLGFKNFDIVVVDTLQIKSQCIDTIIEIYKETTSIDEALGSVPSIPTALMVSCKKSGASWINGAADDFREVLGVNLPSKVDDMISKVGKNNVTLKIIRWNHIAPNKRTLQNSEEFDRFNKYSEIIHGIYKNGSEFKNAIVVNFEGSNIKVSTFSQAVDLDVKNYLHRRLELLKKDIDFSQPDAEKNLEIIIAKLNELSKEYVLDEVAAYLAFYEANNKLSFSSDYLAYPGGLLYSLDLARNNLENFGFDATPQNLPYQELNLSIGRAKQQNFKKDGSLESETSSSENFADARSGSSEEEISNSPSTNQEFVPATNPPQNFGSNPGNNPSAMFAPNESGDRGVIIDEDTQAYMAFMQQQRQDFTLFLREKNKTRADFSLPNNGSKAIYSNHM